jgi:hypothetical protein
VTSNRGTERARQAPDPTPLASAHSHPGLIGPPQNPAISLAERTFSKKSPAHGHNLAIETGITSARATADAPSLSDIKLGFKAADI